MPAFVGILTLGVRGTRLREPIEPWPTNGEAPVRGAHRGFARGGAEAVQS